MSLGSEAKEEQLIADALYEQEQIVKKRAGLQYSVGKAFDVADGLVYGNAMAAAKTLAVQARFYFKKYEELRKAMASMGTRTSKGE